MDLICSVVRYLLGSLVHMLTMFCAAAGVVYGDWSFNNITLTISVPLMLSGPKV